MYHTGRLIDHVHLRTRDFEKARVFYSAILSALNIPITASGDNWFQVDELYVDTADAATQPTHVHLAFQAASADMVAAFHRATLDAGGVDNGGPGERPYHPGYYAAFVLDPDGNNLEAVYHGPNTRSAASVLIDPTAS